MNSLNSAVSQAWYSYNFLASISTLSTKHFYLLLLDALVVNLVLSVVVTIDYLYHSTVSSAFRVCIFSNLFFGWWCNVSGCLWQREYQAIVLNIKSVCICMCLYSCIRLLIYYFTRIWNQNIFDTLVFNPNFTMVWLIILFMNFICFIYRFNFDSFFIR